MRFGNRRSVTYFSHVVQAQHSLIMIILTTQRWSWHDNTWGMWLEDATDKCLQAYFVFDPDIGVGGHGVGPGGLVPGGVGTGALGVGGLVPGMQHISPIITRIHLHIFISFYSIVLLYFTQGGMEGSSLNKVGFYAHIVVFC